MLHCDAAVVTCKVASPSMLEHTYLRGTGVLACKRDVYCPYPIYWLSDMPYYQLVQQVLIVMKLVLAQVHAGVTNWSGCAQCNEVNPEELPMLQLPSSQYLNRQACSQPGTSLLAKERASSLLASPRTHGCTGCSRPTYQHMLQSVSMGRIAACIWPTGWSHACCAACRWTPSSTLCKLMATAQLFACDICSRLTAQCSFCPAISMSGTMISSSPSGKLTFKTLQ